jgi:lipooligosaccharide transport system ATP-binding protein
MTQNSTPLIEARNLTKRFGESEVVRGIDFAIPRGVCFGFLGPNGAGKTTTLRMLMGISPISAGELNIFGLKMPDQGREIRARMGIVPQIDNLDPDFTVAENLRIYGSYFGLAKGILDQRIPELLDFVELKEKADVRIGKLSGGMLRRLTIARALVNDPELIVLDEPTTGLDPQVRHAIWGRMRELLRRGKTLLLTTHYMDEAERLCDRLVILDHGEILADGAPSALIQEHIESEVVEFRGDLPADLRPQLEQMPGCRLEQVGDMLYCYTRDARALIDATAAAQQEITFLHRRGNLEDLFLKLTGRELRK